MVQKFQGAEFIPAPKMERIKAGIAKPRVFLNAIGVLAASRCRETFRNQGRGKVRWPARAIPSLPGVIADCNFGRKPRPLRFQERQALLVTGNLRNSIRHRVASDTIVEIRAAKYGRAMELGTGASHTLTNSGAKVLDKFLRSKTGKALPTDHRVKLGRLIAIRTIRWKPKKRPFAFLTPTDKRDIGKLILATLAKPGGR